MTNELKTTIVESLRNHFVIRRIIGSNKEELLRLESRSNNSDRKIVTWQQAKEVFRILNDLDFMC